MDKLCREIRMNLLKLQDLKYKEFHGTLCNTCNYEIIGVRIPEIREYAKELIKEDYTKFLNSKDIKYYEEIMLKGIIIGTSKMTLEDTFTQLEKFIPYIDNWAVCDITCSSLKITKKYIYEMWNFLQKYINSNKEYEIRFAIVMYLSYFINSQYLSKIFEQIELIKNEGYYAKMAIAWLISIAYIKEKKQTLEFLKNTRIDSWTYNKALQKIIESYRISSEEKELIKKMKKSMC